MPAVASFTIDIRGVAKEVLWYNPATDVLMCNDEHGCVLKNAAGEVVYEVDHPVNQVSLVGILAPGAYTAELRAPPI